MRCKVGDMAIVVRSKAGNEGKICTCLKMYPAGYDGIREEFGPIWEVDTEMNGVWFNDSLLIIGCKTMPDMNLHPIRDNPGQDESLIWQPHKETA